MAWFLLLWSIAFVRVLLSPVLFASKKLFFFFCILLGIYLCLGAVIYQTHYTRSQLARRQFEKQKVVFMKKKEELLILYSAHPTAIDVLKELSHISCTLRQEDCNKYREELRFVDPTSL